MYLKAFNRSSGPSNGITAGASGIITEGFSILQTGRNANLTEINFASASANPFGTDTSITGITAAAYPNPGTPGYVQAFVNLVDLPLRAEIIRPASSDATNFGFLFNRGIAAGLDASGRQTIANLGALVDSVGVDLTDGLATAGTIFRLIDENGRIVTTDMVVTAAVAAASFAWIQIDNIATFAEIEAYFIDQTAYQVESDDDVVQATGRQLRVQVVSNPKATDGNGIWELYNDNGTKLASN